MFVDSHAHVDYELFDDDREQVISRAKDAGLSNIIQIALGPEEEKIARAYDLVMQDDFFRMAVGLHPHDADHFTEDIQLMIASYLDKERVVALGEIGLDYYYDHSDRGNQQHCFEQLISLAIKEQKPIAVHTRDAFEDTLSIVKNQDVFSLVGGVIHCFTGTKEQAKAYLDLGAYISFSGVVSFAKAASVQEAAAYVPLDRMLIETDSPYLAPTPHRGKRNEPCFVVEVAKKIAQLQGVDVDQVGTQTTRNCATLFNMS